MIFTTYFYIQERKSIIMFMFVNKFDIPMLCVHIFYELLQLFMRIKVDKNIINEPPINVRGKNLVGKWKATVFQNDKEMRWLKWVLAGILWQHRVLLPIRWCWHGIAARTNFSQSIYLPFWKSVAFWLPTRLFS